jgi:hypothetical protein
MDLVLIIASCLIAMVMNVTSFGLIGKTSGTQFSCFTGTNTTNTANTAKLIAMVMNVTSCGLIGKTSATTFQVVGHSKTCLVLSLLAFLVQKYTY